MGEPSRSDDLPTADAAPEPRPVRRDAPGLRRRPDRDGSRGRGRPRAEHRDLVPVAWVYRGRAGLPRTTADPGPSRLVPLLSQVRGYSGARLRIDTMAGLTVAALTLPSAMAYAEVAGVPVTTGLYTLIAPVLIYAFLSSTPRTVVGPEGTVALVTGAAVAPLAGGDPAKWVALVSMLAIMTGLMFLVARLLRIGWMADYLSHAVLVGYIAGVAIVLIIGQIGKLTGIPVGRWQRPAGAVGIRDEPGSRQSRDRGRRPGFDGDPRRDAPLAAGLALGPDRGRPWHRRCLGAGTWPARALPWSGRFPPGCPHWSSRPSTWPTCAPWWSRPSASSWSASRTRS